MTQLKFIYNFSTGRHIYLNTHTCVRNTFISIFVILLVVLNLSLYIDFVFCIENTCSNDNDGNGCDNIDTIETSTLFGEDNNNNQNRKESSSFQVSEDVIERGRKLKGCIDRHEHCQHFASFGECDKNPGWMTMFCPVSCDNCYLLDPSIRCNRDRLQMNSEPSYKPGDMNAMFESIVTRYSDNRYGEIKVLSTSPWVVVFENFVSDDEIDALIETNKDSFERSTDQGQVNQFGEQEKIVSQSRTSSNSWCREECESHPSTQALIKKIEDVTRIPYENYESFQVLEYVNGQKYTLHHDNGDGDPRSNYPSGPRILTFFLYLSDVEEGGATAFPSLGLSVKPKKGQALLWPSTLSENPERTDHRTYHEAQPVIKGVKYAANTWIHLYNYRIPNLWGCTGAFD